MGCWGWPRCVALEGAAKGVTCNTISPGTVATGLTRIGSSFRVKQGGQGRDVEENLRLIAEGYPQRRLIETSEIAALAVYSAGGGARHHRRGYHRLGRRTVVSGKVPA